MFSLHRFFDLFRLLGFKLSDRHWFFDLFGLLGFGGGGLIGSLATALVGAIVLLFLIGLVKKG